MRHWWAPRTSNPYHSSNISDLTPKSMQTNADKALECRQNADKLQTNRKERYGKVEAPSNQGEYFYQPGRWDLYTGI